jgi:HNH endonuclease
MAKADLTAQRLRELLHYDPETGVFTWRVKRGGTNIGDVAGCLQDDGYLVIGVDYHVHLAHRLAWLYMTGAWPTCQIDHRFGVRADNRFSELRDVKERVNSQNMRAARSDSKSGLLGASWSKQAKKWHARIHVNKTYKHLGYFDTPEAAHEAYVAAKRKFHEGCTI